MVAYTEFPAERRWCQMQGFHLHAIPGWADRAPCLNSTNLAYSAHRSVACTNLAALPVFPGRQERSVMPGFPQWSSTRESNPCHQLGRLRCYRYTSAAFVRPPRIALGRTKCEAHAGTDFMEDREQPLTPRAVFVAYIPRSEPGYTE